MTKKARSGVVLLYIVGALLLALGAVSLVVFDLPPHLLDYLGRSADEVDPKFAQAIFMLIKIIGVLYLGIGAALIVMTKRLLPRDLNGARLAITLLLLPYLFIPIVTMPAGFAPPMVYVPIILFCAVAALVLVGDMEDVETSQRATGRTV